MMDSIWWYIGAGTTIGGIQLVLGIAIGLWIRRGGGQPSEDDQVSARRAHEFATELAALTSNVTRDVDRHQAQVSAINGRLDAATQTSSDSLTNLVVGVVGELMRANQELHTQLAEAESELRQKTTEIENHLSKSLTDELTGLPNRRSFEEALQMRLKGWRLHRVPFTLVLLDIDHFKNVNDEYGHVAGDRVLCTVTEAVRTALRKPDLVTRYGGEEFAVLLPYTTLEESVLAVSKALAAVGAAVTRSDGIELCVTTSAGVASVLDDENATELIKRADEALYASKHAGRNCAHTHDGQTCQLISDHRVADNGPPAALQPLPPDSTPQLSPEMEAICADLRDRAAELASDAHNFASS